MYNRFYPLVTQFDGNDLDDTNVVNSQKQENESNKCNNNGGGNNKWFNRVRIKKELIKWKKFQFHQIKIKVSQQISSANSNSSHNIMASSSARKNEQPQPDWQHILERIETYAQGFPPIDEEGIVHLQQGMHFIFCDQFVNTIRYGAELFHGMIVRNFIDCPNGFFNELFKVYFLMNLQKINI